jgi:IS5 family transposase
MGQRRIGQLGFLDGALSERSGGRRDVLDALSKLLDWSAFERILSVISVAAKGEPSYPPLMMFKVLLLQRWYGLSDPAMEAALFDRVSFQRFAGLSDRELSFSQLHAKPSGEILYELPCHAAGTRAARRRPFQCLTREVVAAQRNAEMRDVAFHHGKILVLAAAVEPEPQTEAV